MFKISINLLGPLEVIRDGVRVDPSAFGSRKALEVLRLLVDARGTVVTDDLLLHEVWPDLAPERALRSLRVRLTELRKLLSPQDLKPELLERVGNGYRLMAAPGRLTVDVDEFQALFSKAMALSTLDQALPLLERCIALYKGDYMADDPDALQWHDSRLRYRKKYHAASSRLAAAYEELGRYDEGIRLLQRLLSGPNRDEGHYRQLICLHYLNGDQAGALHVYQECKSYLINELGVTPMPQTMRLLQQILRHEEIKPAETRRQGLASVQPQPAMPKVDRPFLEHQRKLTQLRERVKALQAGRGGTVWLHGQSSIRKTRLLQDLLEEAATRAQCRVMWIQGSTLNAHIPFADVLDALQTGVQPRLTPKEKRNLLTPPLSFLERLTGWVGDSKEKNRTLATPAFDLKDLWLRQELLEAFRRLARQKPLICCIDDADLLDSASQSFLLGLARRTSKWPLLILAATRHPLEEARLGREFARSGLKALTINI